MNQQDKNRLLDAYQKGTIGSEDKRLLELAALEDAFLFEALEGSHGSEISVDQLRERLHSKVKKERRRVMWLPAVAATLLVVSAVMWWNNSDETSLSTEKQYVKLEEPFVDQEFSSEGNNDMMVINEDQSTSPAKTTVSRPTTDGVAIAPKEKDKIENQTQTPKKQLDAYVAQKPAVSAPAVKPVSPPAVEEEYTEENAGAVVADMSTKEYSESVVTVDMKDEASKIEGEKNILSTHSAPAGARAKVAAPKKEKKRKMEQEADLADDEYPILDEIVVTNMKTSSPLMGYDELNKFILKNKLIGLQYQDIKGRVRVKFTADEQGVLTNFEILKSINETVDKHTIELMKKTGVWTPGEASYTVQY